MIVGRPAAVHARGWGWRHASRRAWALRDVSFEIGVGERVLLLGASGSGKSTLLHGLAGVLGGDEEGDAEGELLLDGRPAADVRGRAGLVLQDPDSQVILARVGDDVAFGCENLGIPRDETWRRVDEALAAVGLDVPKDRPTKHLSGGQKQRLALAGALAMRPGLLVLDEPTANLDPQGVADVRDAVAGLLDRTGTTFVVVEHRTEVWLPIVDRVIVLGDGGVVADGTPADVLGSNGRRLAEAGVWVPGIPPAVPAPPARPHGDVLLSARGLAVERLRGLPVATGVDLDVHAGGALAITGPNGAGKSTLGLTLAGLLPPAAGTLRATEALAAGAGPAPWSWRSRELLTRIGTVFQDPEHQLLAPTVREELEVGPRALRLGEAETARRVDELLGRLRLSSLARANPYTLSGGEKRRLTVAAALATRPRVLVLDEPTFGQDSVTWAELVALLAGLRDEGSAIVTITHDAAVVEALHARRVELRG
ncbi:MULTISPECIES: ABC transporter ATP-binding protein [Microbacterium]|uniref:Energy-coupling factor transport system ATP-binding protein n=1 Tax=Microbacterium saccharophilum TaxID=1213358 RepID=A0A7Z7GD49_9MICO|nr:MULTISPECIES: ATP-binding cassette domain-containing protein [Microbacterium]SFI48685.1 energy-coupling factor transport system ATP-binding protein [Microbacterium saccharophilum]